MTDVAAEQNLLRQVGAGRAARPVWADTFRRDASSAFLAGVYTGVLGPFLGLVAAKTLHAPVFLLSVMMAAPFVGNMLTPLWVHHLHGRPKLPFVVGPGVIARALYLLLGVVHTAGQFVGVVFCAQLFEASSGPAYSAVMERVYPAERRGRLMSLVRVVRTLAVIAVTVAAGHVLDQWGYHAVFTAAAVFGLGASTVFAAIRVPPELDRLERETPAATPGAAWGIFRTDRAYRTFGISVFLYGLGNLLLGPIYPLFAANTLHLTYAQQGALSFTSAVAAVAAFFVWGHFLDRFGPVRCVHLSIGIVLLKPVLWFFAPSFAWLVAPAIFDGISGAGIEIGYINSILSFSPPERVPAYQSLHATLLGIRGVLAPVLASVLVTALQERHLSIRLTFLVSAALMLVSLWMYRRVLHRGAFSNRGEGI